MGVVTSGNWEIYLIGPFSRSFLLPALYFTGPNYYRFCISAKISNFGNFSVLYTKPGHIMTIHHVMNICVYTYFYYLLHRYYTIGLPLDYHLPLRRLVPANTP